MAKAISAERRQEAVTAYITRKAQDPSVTYESIAAEFNVGEASLNRWIRRLREEGTVERRKPRRDPGKRVLSPAHSEAIVQWVTANPAGRLWELRQHLAQAHGAVVSASTLRRELAQRGLGKRRLSKLTEVDDAAPDTSAERRFGARHRRAQALRPDRRSYPSDFTEAEWSAVEPLWREHARALPEKHGLRDVVEALRYIGATGCPWRYLPNDFPPFQTVRRWFDEWHHDGTIARVNDALRRLLRRRAGREETPSLLIVDSQSVKTQEGGEARGYDGGKKIAGRKRHIAVDTMGLPWLLAVHSAAIQDRDGIDLVVPDDVSTALPRLKTIIADAGYQGRAEQRTHDRTGIPVKIARRRGDTTTGEWAKKDEPAPTYDPGFKVVSKRWIVERSFAWTTRRRRLARDFERSTGASKTWLELSFQHIMTARMIA